MAYLNPWTHKSLPVDDSELPEGAIAFVYLITNTQNNKKYIGKKMLFFTRTKRVKGKKQKKVIDSDWKTYYGSSRELLEDLEKSTPEAFKREILVWCHSKGEASYQETKLQFENGVLLSENFYNSWIQCKIAKNHVKRLIK